MPADAPSRKQGRMLGVGMVFAGAGLAWFFGLRVLQQAQAGAQTVELPSKAFMLAPMLLLFGLALVIGGAPVREALSGPPRTRQQHAIIWPMFFVALGAGFATWWWMREQIHALGYVF